MNDDTFPNPPPDLLLLQQQQQQQPLPLPRAPHPRTHFRRSFKNFSKIEKDFEFFVFSRIPPKERKRGHKYYIFYILGKSWETSQVVRRRTPNVQESDRSRGWDAQIILGDAGQSLSRKLQRRRRSFPKSGASYVRWSFCDSQCSCQIEKCFKYGGELDFHLTKEEREQAEEGRGRTYDWIRRQTIWDLALNWKSWYDFLEELRVCIP